MTNTAPSSTAPAIHIFVSYSARTDDERELSERLVDLLSTAFGIPSKAIFAYTAPGHGPAAGAKLLDELKEALAASKVVLAIVSPAAAASSFTQFEVAAGDLAGKYSVPLLADPSFQSHVPVVLQDVTGRSLASLGDICQLLEDLRGPLGITGVGASNLWITKAEHVVEAAHRVSRHVAPEVRTARRAGFALAAVAAAALAAAAVFGWMSATRQERVEQVQAELKIVSEKLTAYEKANLDLERRTLLRPALKIEGTVQTAAGKPAGHAVVAACTALPRPGTSPQAAGDVCPEELRLNWETDSDGEFALDLGSLPAGALPPGASPPDGIWLIAERASEGRVNKRVPTVLRTNLTLRP